jgi:hypothetical protein
MNLLKALSSGNHYSCMLENGFPAWAVITQELSLKVFSIRHFIYLPFEGCWCPQFDSTYSSEDKNRTKFCNVEVLINLSNGQSSKQIENNNVFSSGHYCVHNNLYQQYATLILRLLMTE